MKWCRFQIGTHVSDGCDEDDRMIYQLADEPKELILYPETERELRECQGDLHDLLRRWIPEKLSAA